jgi:hypothetical protein
MNTDWLTELEAVLARAEQAKSYAWKLGICGPWSDACEIVNTIRTLLEAEKNRPNYETVAGLRRLAPRGGDEREQQNLSGAKTPNAKLSDAGGKP